MIFSRLTLKIVSGRRLAIRNMDSGLVLILPKMIDHVRKPLDPAIATGAAPFVRRGVPDRGGASVKRFVTVYGAASAWGS